MYLGRLGSSLEGEGVQKDRSPPQITNEDTLYTHKLIFFFQILKGSGSPYFCPLSFYVLVFLFERGFHFLLQNSILSILISSKTSFLFLTFLLFPVNEFRQNINKAEQIATKTPCR